MPSGSPGVRDRVMVPPVRREETAEDRPPDAATATVTDQASRRDILALTVASTGGLLGEVAITGGNNSMTSTTVFDPPDWDVLRRRIGGSVISSGAADFAKLAGCLWMHAGSSSSEAWG